MNLTEIDGKIGIWLVLAIVASVVAVIYVLKSIFKKTATEDLASKYKDKKWDSPMEGTYKYPDVDVFGMSGPIFRYGLAAALALSVIGLNWTSYDKKVIIPTGALAFDDEIQVEVPRTAEPPPPPPPPPPPVVQEIKVTEEKIEEKVEFVDQSIQEETVVEAPPPPAPKKEAPPPPPPVIEEILVVKDLARRVLPDGSLNGPDFVTDLGGGGDKIVVRQGIVGANDFYPCIFEAGIGVGAGRCHICDIQGAVGGRGII